MRLSPLSNSLLPHIYFAVLVNPNNWHMANIRAPPSCAQHDLRVMIQAPSPHHTRINSTSAHCRVHIGSDQTHFLLIHKCEA